ncbi:MAG: SpoIVB peptidase [Clostridiales bacterium]|nr:SpoIVB peptidase [Clostridiales bacterium]MCD7886594.1 SpoIVB peptidase [Clostridiales bacterium]
MKEEKQTAHPAVLAGLAMVLALALLLAAVGWGRWRPAVRCSGQAEPTMLVPVGKTVGIKLFSHGVMVVGLEEISTAQGSYSPAKESGLKVGDIITQLDGQQVDTIEQVEEILRQQSGETLSVTALRAGRRLEVAAEAAPCLADGSYKLGAWVRDSMAGIGTVTWYDPATGRFCALGHGINDVDTSLLMPLKTGGIMSATVTSAVKGSSGHPGQLHGTFDLTQDLGSLTENTDCGVFGQFCGELDGEALPVAERSQVSTGAATILCNVEGDEVKEYSVEILRLYPAAASETRNLLLQVTDPDLLDATGGIVQGMSGSPILQDGRLVGAVTHVLVNDPTRGYGILAETMLDACGG